MSTRRGARETAFQFLYGAMPVASAGGSTPEQIVSRENFDAFCRNFERECDDFAWVLVSGVGKNLPLLDREIHSHSTNWRIERMPFVDLTVLRLAAFEIIFLEEIPKTVAINEAIEMAKKFGAEDSPAFMNGLLDKLEKSPVK